jgi:hypothetical protein
MLTVTCADPRRVARVQQQMRREIGNMFQNDAKIKGMLNPDVKFGVDVNNTTLATVADCEVYLKINLFLFLLLLLLLSASLLFVVVLFLSLSFTT